MADVGEIRARLVLSSDQFTRGMQQARGEMDRSGQSAARLRIGMDEIQKASMAMGAALVVGVGAAVKTAADFEQAMANVKAVSGASADEMNTLSKAARDFAEHSQFDPTQIAGGIEELVKAGLTVQQVIGGGLKGALDLAAAGGISLGDAAEIASTALNSFKKDALSVSQASDLLAGAANASATDVGELKFGLSMVSAVASGVGLTFKDVTSSLALFAQAGLRGSDAGTSLKTLLLNLTPTTKKASTEMKKLGLETENGSVAFYDAKGHIKSMSDIAEILHTKLAKLTDQQRQQALQTMFGTDAIRAANILYSAGAKGLNEMTDAMLKIKAADVAKVKMDTLKGSFKEFQATLQNVGITLGEEFLPAFTDIVRFATDLIRRFGDVDMSTVKVGLAFAGTATAILLVGSTIAKLSIALRAFALTPVGAAITALSILGGLIASVVVHQNEMSQVTLDNANAMIKQHDSLDETIKQYDGLRSKAKLSNDELGRFVDINSEISKTADPNVIARLKDEQEKLRIKSGLSNDEMQRLVDLNGKIIDVVPESNTKLTDQGNILLNNTDAAKKYNAQQLEMVRLELEAQKAKAEANQKDYLAKEEATLKSIKDLKTKMGDLDKDEIDHRGRVAKLYSDLAVAKANNDEYEQANLKEQISMEEGKLESIKHQRAEAAQLIVNKSKELDKIQEQLGKLDEVKRKMVDIELQQVGINAKRGTEISTLDTAISKLQTQKAELEKSVPINQRNTAEYRAARDAIQEQINKLQGTKSKVEEIIGKAKAMNAELGKDVSKNFTVYQNAVASNSYNNYKANALKYHTGGIVGKPPQLHVGGLASQFASAPSHNEIDVRLLRNEAVLTEAQQSNLMRMIDAGFTQKSPQSTQAQSVVQQNYITVEGNIDRDLYDEIMTRQTTEMNTKFMLNGVKR